MINFMQVIEMTDEEKIKMYMEVDHETLVKMHVELEKHFKEVLDAYRQLSNGGITAMFKME